MKNKPIFIILLLKFALTFSQYFKEDIFLPDSFSGVVYPSGIVWNEIEDKIYFFSNQIVAIDCENDEKVLPIRIERDFTFYYDFIWHKRNNCVYLIKGRVFRLTGGGLIGEHDSILIYDGRTHQKIKSIPLPSEFPTPTNLEYFSFASSYKSNKVYVFYKDTLILVIDGNSNNIIKEVNISKYPPFNIKLLNPLNNIIYLYNFDINKIYLFSCYLDSIIDSILLPFHLSYVSLSPLILDTFRNRLIVLLGDSAHLDKITYIIDCNNHQIIDSVRYFLNTNFLLFSAFNYRYNKIYFWNPCIHNDTIAILDLELKRAYYLSVGVAWTLVYNPHNNIVYCDIMGNDILLIDGKNDIIVGSITLRTYSLPPLFCHPVRNKLYCNIEGYGALAVIDGEQNIVTKYIKIGRLPGGYDMSYNPVNNKIYLPCADGPYICIIDAQSNKCIKTIDAYPLIGDEPIFYSEVCTTLNKVYFSSWNYLLILDGNRDTIVRVIQLPPPYRQLTWHPFYNKLYAVPAQSGWLIPELLTYIIDCNNDQILNILPTGACPSTYGKAFISPDGEKVYIYIPFNIYNPQSIRGYWVICARGDTFIKWLDSLHGLAVFKKNSNILYIGFYGDRYPSQPPPLVILDWKKDTIIGKIEGVGGYSIIYDTFNNRLYSPAYKGGKIFVIDCERNEVIDTIFDIGTWEGRDARLLIWNPKTNKIYGRGTEIIGDTIYQTIKVIDCFSNQIIKNIREPEYNQSSIPFCFNPRENLVYFDNTDQSSLIVIKDEITGIYTSDLENKKGLLTFSTIR
ncbi:MAG: hypothetical protein ABIK46_04670, partial [candidate division WOR-3 bacterium]